MCVSSRRRDYAKLFILPCAGAAGATALNGKVLVSRSLGALLSCFLLLTSALGETLRPLGREELTAQIRSGVKSLNALYLSRTLGIWLDRPGDDLRAHLEGRLNPPWWPSANAVEVLLDFMDATGTADYDQLIETLYALQKDHPGRRARLVAELKQRGQWADRDEEREQRRSREGAVPPRRKVGYYSDFQNEYLDDSGWWGITWLKMYDRTGAENYLATAKTIHGHMARNWNPEKGGGVLWSEDENKQVPNAITNNLFLLLSARLYRRTGEQSYLEWAERTLAWIRANALYDGVAVVDGPGHKGDYWSYNQGTFIGGLTSLYLATGRQEHLDEAAKVAESVLQRSGLVLRNGVLVEKLGTKGDASLFKGVFIRYLAQLHDLLRAQKRHSRIADEIERCIRNSVNSMLQHARAPEGVFTVEWHEGAKDRGTGFNAQVSALAALVALLSNEQL